MHTIAKNLILTQNIFDVILCEYGIYFLSVMILFSLGTINSLNYYVEGTASLGIREWECSVKGLE
jgi:hypothetical protein